MKRDIEPVIRFLFLVLVDLAAFIRRNLSASAIKSLSRSLTIISV